MNRLEERLRSSLHRAATDLPRADPVRSPGTADGARRRPGSGLLVVAAAALVTVVLAAPLIIRPLDPQGNAASTTVAQAPSESTLPLLERRNPPPIGDAESPLMAASGDVLVASATIPDANAWIVRVWRSIDGGFTWEETLTLTDEGIDVALEADEEQAVLVLSDHVGSGGARAYRSTDGGLTWTHIDLAAPTASVGIAATAVALGENTVIAGQAWDGEREESPADGVALTSHEGRRAITWVIENGVASPPVDLPEIGVVSSMLVHDGRYYATGSGLETSAVPSPELWVSGDGVAWSKVALPPLPDTWQFDDDTMSIATSESALVAAAELRAGPKSGFADTRDHVATAIYRSVDGGGWTLTVIEDMRISPIYASSGGLVGRIEVGSTETDGRTYVGLSGDGLSWSITGEPVALTDAVSTDEGSFVVGVDPGSDHAVGLWFVAR